MPDAPSAVEALRALDALLADRPDRVSHHFSAATQHLTAYRKALLAFWGGVLSDQERRERLSHLNAVISVVYGTHYPTGSPKWDVLQQARDDFAAHMR